MWGDGKNTPGSNRPEQVDKLPQRSDKVVPGLAKSIDTYNPRKFYDFNKPSHMGANPMQNTQDCHLIQRQTHTYPSHGMTVMVRFPGMNLGRCNRRTRRGIDGSNPSISTWYSTSRGRQGMSSAHCCDARREVSTPETIRKRGHTVAASTERCGRL